MSICSDRAIMPVDPAVQHYSVPEDENVVDTTGRVERRQFSYGAMAIIIGFHVLALLAVLPMFFTWKALITTLILQFLCGMGVTVGYHRLLAHRSFQCPRVIEYFITWLGVLNLQSGPIKWTATHRLHHQHSDEEGDPHSPKDGFFWSHVLWIFQYLPNWDPYERYSRYAKDLARDKGHVFLERTAILWQVALAVALYAWGGWPCVVWGIFVRVVYVWNSTWFVNSASHTWGYRNFATSDVSRNLWWVALISYGEGWHNNHHAYPRSARHGMKPWEFDFTYLVIRGMRAIGLARDVRLPEQGASRAG